MIVSGSFDTTLKLWNCETGELKFTLVGHSHTVILNSFFHHFIELIEFENYFEISIHFSICDFILNIQFSIYFNRFHVVHSQMMEEISFSLLLVIQHSNCGIPMMEY
jgi:WD40 repeat protein